MAILKRAQIKSMQLIGVDPAKPGAEKSVFYKTIFSNEMHEVVKSLFAPCVTDNYAIAGMSAPNVAQGEANWVVELEDVHFLGNPPPPIYKYAQISSDMLADAMGTYLEKTYAQELKGQDIRVVNIAPLVMDRFGSYTNLTRWTVEVHSCRKSDVE